MNRALVIMGIFGTAAALSTLAIGQTTSGGESEDTVTPNMKKVPAPPIDTPPDLYGKVIKFSASIAEAEGFFVDGSVPQRYHNPGDLSPGDTGFPGDLHDGSTVSRLPDDVTGWNMLYKKVTRMLSGQSSTYPITWTFKQVAQEYASNWQPWLATHVRNLGVSENTTLAEYVRS